MARDLLFYEAIMKIIEKNVDELIPYENNPRRNDEAVNLVANSIENFGFKVPIVIDSNNVVVTGHTRLKASKMLGLDRVPCIVADDLTDEQIKAFRLADNKVAEQADWDYTLLDLELEDLTIDMEQFGFEFEEIDVFAEEPIKRNERLRTDDAYKLIYNDADRLDGWFEMPMIAKEDFKPNDLIGFNYAKTATRRDCGIHFYLDDYQFERIWNDTEQYIDLLSEYECVLSPNFSIYMDMPRAMKIWNTYRSRLIGQILQDAGLTVIPTICWAEEETFKFAFDGIEKGSTVSISTIGVKNDKEAMEIWQKGCKAMIEAIEPKRILLYGGMVDYDFGDIEVVEYVNHVTEDMKEG